MRGSPDAAQRFLQHCYLSRMVEIVLHDSVKHHIPRVIGSLAWLFVKLLVAQFSNRCPQPAVRFDQALNSSAPGSFAYFPNRRPILLGCDGQSLAH
jgi:hypothetical protein